MTRVASALVMQFAILGLWQPISRWLNLGSTSVAGYLANSVILMVALLSSGALFCCKPRALFGGISWRVIGLAFTWGLFLAVFMNWISKILAQYFSKVYQPQLVSDLLLQQDGMLLLVLLIFTCIIGPTVEEIFFRGFVQAELTSTYGVKWAIILSGVIFGLYHFDLIRFLPLATAGLVLGYIRYKYLTIWAPIITHVTWNTVTAFLLLK